ncbi:multidrug resistance-associated protein 5-like isoform X1 [Venturia canescens]|uniref:multidrug resistance-associated protein 5-like isoform X1 n=2 Tax=Venturia canescens TaxID=32260 RepID=UPI001C9C29BF|nr:multidrug resistance-associated protein 5-like isoform X1 [Venturia canescens]
MKKIYRHRGEIDSMAECDDRNSKIVPLVNGISVNATIKPYRRSASWARYGNALKNLIPVRTNQKPTGSMPIDDAGLYSTIFGAWLTKYLWKAYRQGGSNLRDLPTISPYDTCEYNSQRLEILWNEEVARHGMNAASFGKAAWRFNRTRCLASCIILTVAIILGFLSSVLLMRKLLEFIESSEGTIGEGIKWAFLLSLCDMTRTMLLTWSWNNNYRTALRFKNAYLGMLYRKIIRLNDFGSKSSGKLINMMSNDGQRMFDACVFAPTIIGGPIVTICGITYILWILSPMALFGILAFFLFYPIQYSISRLNGYFKSKSIKISDERVSAVNEILDCIKLIKMYAWEEPFRLNLMDVRTREKRWLHRITYTRSFGISLSPTIPVISAIVAFLAHVAGGNNLTAAQVFPFVTLLNTQIRHMLSFVEISITSIIEARICCERFKSTLVMEESHYHIPKPIVKTQALSIVNGTFTCEANEEFVETKKDKKSNTKKRRDGNMNAQDTSENLLPAQKRVEILKEITFEASKGKLIGICGHVGSGKTSLLLAALGQMRLASGQLARDGSCAYVSQQAWILHATFRENVVFGETFDSERYHTAIDSCCLRQDLNSFPAGDETEIGERGINLSGGQKQRVALARAFYSDRDIYFLDDPLSAVDAHVGAYIFDNLIHGALKGKTILFVTHQVQYLNRCDEIYMMSNGRIVEHGVHKELMDANNKYATMVKSMIRKAEQASSNEDDSFETENNEKNIFSSEVQAVDDDKDTENGKSAPSASIMVPDKLETGNITSQTYLAYIQAAGGYFVAFFLLLTFTLNVGSTAFSSWWLAHWIKASSGPAAVDRRNETISSSSILDNPDHGYYETIYGICILVILVTSGLRSLGLTRASIRASTSLHNCVFAKVLSSPMQFFETTPRGRIQNLFSRDTDEVDTHLPISLEGLLQNSLICIFSLGFICAVIPWFVIVIIFLGCIFYYIGKVFRIALRDLKRFESSTRSPVFSFATATVQGLDTIHAFEKENDFIKQFQGYLDVNGGCQYICNIALRWLAVRFDTLAGIATGTTALLVVFLKGQVPPALAGLAMSYSGQMSGVFQFTMRTFSETELRFISVERINHYLKTLIDENKGTKPSTTPLVDWPRNGQIEFEDVELKYRDNLPTVLNRISFRIEANEKIGIVGRTGSGKSSILVALFRLVESSRGKIKIDGVDTSEIDLKCLRSNISIIPQDPVLFNASVRFNLNPHGDRSEYDLWTVLEKTQLKEKVRSMPGQLNGMIEAGGVNLSMGERQLLCLARALLRKSKILVLDEATAAVDPETEAIVQTTIQREFSECTILTIAHRLQTVLSCDRILVLDNGDVVEFDTPSKLLDDPYSEFSKMIDAADKAIKGSRHYQYSR